MRGEGGMNRLLIIGAGGLVGAILRYWVSGWVQRWQIRFYRTISRK